MTRENVKASAELAQVIDSWPADQKMALGDMIALRATELKKEYERVGAIEFMKRFYELFDKTVAMARAKDNMGVSCKRGCHLCCRQNVDVSEAEVLLIVDFCKKNNIPISKARLEEQLKYGIREMAKTEAGWCVFLKGKECGIYSVRPLACRKYFVVSPPERCDVVAFPSEKFNVSVAVFTMPEIEASAFFTAIDDGKSGRMPQVLLPYSK